MSFLKAPMKLLADVLMLFILIGSVGNFWFLMRSDQVVPNNPDDLESVKVTAKALDVTANGNLATLSAEEYPTKFSLGFLGKAPTNLRSAIQVGQRVSVRIKKGRASELPVTLSIVTYGLTLEDGTTVFDTSQELLGSRDNSLTSFNLGNAFFYGMIAIPALYFLARIFFRVRRFSLSKQSLNL